MRFTFKKEERLKSKKIIGRLFNKEGQSFAIHPLRIIWLTTPLPSDYPVQFGTVVPKRHFKKAVARNRIKRQIKETYRLNKHLIYEHLNQKEKQCAIMVVYTGKEEVEFDELDKKMQQIIRKFIKRTKSKVKRTK